MKPILQLKIALFTIFLFSFGAKAQFVDYDRDTKWNLGFNMGAVWQDGDVSLNNPGFGYGLTFGRSIYESPSKFWGLDLRFRYMKGFTYGQNLAATRDSSSSYLDNPIYSTNPSNYRDNLGFTYLNSKTMIHDFNLEAVINFHRLRERTGILLSVYGGVGVTDYRTTTNLLDEDGKLYNYFDIDEASATKKDFRDFLDNTYETNAVFNEDVTVKFMPSLGASIGYQFSPQWSVGIDHRVTFTLQDQFDGIEQAGTQFLQWGDNDKYHYTSIFLRWNIFRGESSTSTRTRDCPPPYLKIADIPEVYTVNDSVFSIRARVSKINSNNDVMFIQDDQIVETSYNANTDYVSGNVILKEGANKLMFIATNACGESIDSVTVIYNPDFCPKGVITILEPSDTVSSRETTLKARVLQLQGGIITVALNNNIVAHSFNASTNELESKLNLNQGVNTYSVRVVNKCGDTSVTKTVVFYCVPPTVAIGSPENGKQYTNGAGNIVASVRNITDKSQIQITHNSQSVVPSLNASTGAVGGSFNMVEGTNTITITVTNDCGTDTKTVIFNYEKPCLLPVVSITTPANGSNVTNSSVNVRGTVSNITNGANVQMTLNGVAVNSGFNNGSFSSNLNLRQGSNTIQVTGVNECGRDAKSITVSYSCPAPSVSLVSPINGTQTSTSRVVISGNTNNVTSQGQLRVTLNGNSVPFTFNASARSFTGTINVAGGQNIIQVVATTPCGTATKTAVVTMNQACPAPVINIVNPANGTSVSSNQLTLSGTAINVTNQSELRVTLNGIAQAFTFNSGTFVAPLSLTTGNNTIQVTATNTCGTDSKTSTVVYNKSCPAPVVNISSPANGMNVSASAITLTGSAMNVTSQSELQVTLNGVNQNFTFNTSNKTFVSPLTLRSGSNTIQVKATNACGTDIKSTTVNYSQACPAPTATISSPRNGLNATSLSVPFTGIVTNVSSASQVTLKVNGISVAKNVNTTNGLVSATLNLKEGGNTIQLTTTTNCGTDTKSVTVSYKCPLPTINIASPNTGMSYSTSPIQFSGFVSGASTQNQIVVKLNGTVIPFTYNAGTKQFSGSMNLVTGSNTLEASVTNQCGTSTKSTTVNYAKSCPPPTVMLTSPNGKGTSASAVQISGLANNVTSQNQISVKLNGATLPISYNASTKVFTSMATLIEGNNTIVATVTNECGTDTKSVSVVYTKACPKPTVAITSPTNGSSPTDQFITINGVTTNVTAQSQIKLTLNGKAIPFTFNAGNQTFVGNYDLTEGNNVIVASVTTPCGTATKTITLKWSKPCPKPTVTISSPNGSAALIAATQITGIAQNVAAKSEITVMLNGASVPFNFNATTKVFSASATLREGSNTIQVKVTNTCGTDTKTVTKTYSKPCPKPTIRITSPANGSSPIDQFVTVNGVTTNVTAKSQMTLKINGVNIPFTFNAGNNSFQGMYDLAEGTNVIVATATNSCGTATSTVTLVWRKPCPKAVVKILSHTNNSSVNTLSTTIIGTATNIAIAGDLKMTVNGAQQRFTYNNTTKGFSSVVNLIAGTNRIVVTATTQCGVVSETLILNASAPVVVTPILSVITPRLDSSGTIAKTSKVNGTVSGITSKSQLKIYINGKAYTGFSFKAIGNGVFSYDGTVSLVPGLNIIEVSATNNAGGKKTITRKITSNQSIEAPIKTEVGEPVPTKTEVTKPATEEPAGRPGRRR